MNCKSCANRPPVDIPTFVSVTCTECGIDLTSSPETLLKEKKD